jgi:D-alanine-D-alanine ligase
MLDPAAKADLKLLVDGDFDIAFIALHGKHGEDGAIQGLLEVLEIPYIGSGVGASALAIDKAKTKECYERAGIRTPKALALSRPPSPPSPSSPSSPPPPLPQGKPAAKILEEVGPRCVVKPASEGSALGVFMVDSAQALEEALGKAFGIDEKVLVETCIEGRELTVGVLGNEAPYALPVIEIVPINEFYDYESKYAPGGSKHLCPAPIAEQTTSEIQALAVKAHQVLGCAGVSRSDFIVDDAGDIWILETNTIPGMTETSLLPDAGRAAGIEFPELCTLLVAYAFERYGR